MNLGRKIREFRQLKGWSLAELAKRSGVALSSLSRIETSRMTGTLESHIDIARALGVRVSELYSSLDGSGPAVEIKSAGEGRDKQLILKGAALTVLSSASLQKKMLPLLIQLGPKKGTPRERGPAGSERFVYLLQGHLEITAGEEKFRLGPGDSAYLQASVPHSFSNVGASTLLAISVGCPPLL